MRLYKDIDSTGCLPVTASLRGVVPSSPPLYIVRVHPPHVLPEPRSFSLSAFSLGNFLRVRAPVGRATRPGTSCHGEESTTFRGNVVSKNFKIVLGKGMARGPNGPPFATFSPRFPAKLGTRVISSRSKTGRGFCLLATFIN